VIVIILGIFYTVKGTEIRGRRNSEQGGKKNRKTSKKRELKVEGWKLKGREG